MYFQIHNNLVNDKPFYESDRMKLKDNVCIVCLENSDHKLSESSFMNSENLKLEKNCSCECFIHQSCLEPWICKNGSCPICRKKMAAVVFRNAMQDENYFIVLYFRTIITSNNLRQVMLFICKLTRVCFLLVYFGLITTIVFDITYRAIVVIQKVI